MITPDFSSTSPFFNDFPPSGEGVVIHCTRSGKSMNPTELEGTLNWFQNPKAKVSSHWVIGRAGEQVRVIPDNKQAWHAGQHNATHWGIELEQGVESDGFTEEQIAALVEVCRGYVEMGVPVAHDMSGFIGHEETPQGQSAGKSDPGDLFPWDDFIAALPLPPSPPRGIGVHYTDGSTAEVWISSQNDAVFKTLDGIGISFADGSTKHLWP